MEISCAVGPIAGGGASVVHAEELGNGGSHRIVDASERAADIGESVLDASAVDPKSHGFATTVDADNLGLSGAEEILGGVGTGEDEGEAIVWNDGAVTKVAGNGAGVVDAKQLCKRGITGTDHGLKHKRGAIS